MSVVLLRALIQLWFALTLCVLLVACGGSSGEGASTPPVAEQPPVSPPVGGSPVEMGLMVAFGYNPQAAGSALRANQVQNLAVGNGTANYRFPRSGESISGNLTIAVDVADPDGITRVLVGFNGSERALVLCTTTCGSSFSQTVTGINPRNFGVEPGSLRLELWLEDQLGNRVMFDARDIEWLPEPVTGVSTSRTATTLDVSWSANSTARRYNLYIAEQPGITPENILSKTGGRQFLALSQTSFSVPAVEANRRYFVLITGVNSSGESLFSEQHLVQPVDAPEFSDPIAEPDQFSLNEDEEFRGSLFGNDSHPDDRSFTLDSQAVRLPDNGSVVLSADGSFVYRSAANFAGTDSFIYQITDTMGLTAQAEVSLTVLPVNDEPLVLDDSFSLSANTSLIIAAPGLLANDLDLEGDTLQVVSLVVTAPAHGSVQLSPDGAFSYTPDDNYSGEDSFVYQVTDGQGGVEQAQVTLRIEMPNAAPVAQNDSYQALEDEVLVVSAAAGVLANDSDPDGDNMSLVSELLSTVQNGQLILASDGSFRYIPAQDFFGTDSFSYQIKDAGGLISQASAVFTVAPQNDPPVVQSADYSVNPNTTLSVAAPGLLAYAMDPDDQELRVVTAVAVAPAKGSVSLAADGSFTYAANPDASGTDSFAFNVVDASGSSGTGTVVINFISDGVAPVLEDSTLQIFDDKPEGHQLTQLFAVDPDLNDSVVFSIVSGNELGLFSLTAAGVLTVADAAQMLEQAGTVQLLVIQVQDSFGLIDQAMLEIEIVSGSVIAKPDRYTLLQDSALIANPGVLANDVESSGALLTASLVTGPSNGQLNLNADGSFVYVPRPSFYGSDSFSYQASNGLSSALARVELIVTRQSFNLNANPDSYTLNEDSPLTVTNTHSLLRNDSFNTSQSFTVSLVQGPANGTLNLNSDGTFSYQPAADAHGNEYFTYRLSQSGQSDIAQVTLVITPVNDAPELQNVSVTILDSYVDLQSVVTMSVSDPDPGSYSFEILSGDAAGVFAITAGGVIKVANQALLNALATASYSLVVKVTENNDAAFTDTATVQITVLPEITTNTTVISDNAFAGGTNLSLQMMLSGDENEPVQILPLNDGRSLIVGTVISSYGQEVFVTRLTADGSIDSSYADRGVFRNQILSDTTEQAVAAVLIGSDELVILANYTEDDSDSGFFLFKLNSAGGLDATFGGLGYIICAVPQCEANATATDLILDNAGKYVVSGTMVDAPPVPDPAVTQAFLYRFGNLSYIDGWKGTVDTLEQFDLVRQDSDDNYYGVGQSSAGFILVARFDPSFDLDSGTFGCTPGCIGYQEYSFSQLSSQAYDAVLHNDDLYVVGSVTDGAAPASPDGLFFKVTSDGNLDSGFGSNSGFTQVDGSASDPLHYQAITLDATGFYILTSTAASSHDLLSVSHYDLAGELEMDQLIVVDGQLKAVDLQSDSTGLWLLNHFSNPDFEDPASVSFNWVGKYNVTTLDPDSLYSSSGHRWFSAGFSNDTLVGSVRLLLGGQVNKTLFYGYSESVQNFGYRQAFVGRLTSSGALDPSFGNHGLTLLADDNLSELEINALIEANPNQFYLAGAGVDVNHADTGFVTRLNPDGSVDTTFAGGVFELTPSVVGSYTGSEAMQLQLRTDGHLVVGAEYSQAAGNVDIAVLQLNTDGTLDAGSFGTVASGFTVFNEIDSAGVKEERLSRMKLDPVDDSLVIAGQYKLSGDPQLYVARLSDNGLLMNITNSAANAFGESGQGFSLINLVDNSSDAFAYSEYLNALDFDAARNLVFAGATASEAADEHFLYRLQSNGLADMSFNFGAPRLYDSFSNQVPVDLEIRQIHVDSSGRLLMAGTYGAYAWVGRVLMDGSGTQAGRWDPAFEPGSVSAGAYLFTNLTLSADLFMQLTSSKVTLGWSNYSNSSYSATMRQYQLFESNPI
jgi:uncharacterized delta-60 repeat protein